MADYTLQYPGATIDQLLAKVNDADSSPTASSSNLVESGGVKSYVDGQTGDLSQLQTTAKNNLVAAINEAAQSGGGGSDPDAVKFTPQTLTSEQKAQARANIDAASLADLADFDFVTDTSLPTASASTMGHIYLVGPDANDNYDRYFTQESGGTYSWVSLGSTQIDLSDYATKDEVTQLEHEVHNLSGKFYGVFADDSDLPEGDAVGYAFVGTENPYAIWNFDGEDWSDSGSVANGITGEPGVGFASIFTPDPYDGTVIIVLSNNDTITLDLNHNHPAYYSKVAETSNPSGGFLPDVVYSLGTLTGTITFSLASPVTGNVNHYFWMFDTGSTAPTVTWPTGITWADGSAPTVSASKHYEISVLDGIAAYLEV